jgi:transglutaminase-like putative cysteine protease
VSEPARPRSAQAGLCLLLAAGIAELAVRRRAPAAWGLLLLPGIALAWRASRLPAALAAAAEKLGWALTGALGLLGFVWTLYPYFSEPTMMRASLLLGLVLAGLSGLFLLGGNGFVPRRTSLPATLGTFAAAALVPDQARGPSLALVVGAAGLVLWLRASQTTLAPPGRAIRSRLALWSFAFLVAGVAAGIITFLPWAQPHVEEASNRLLASGQTGSAGFGNVSRLGEIEELALSQRVALRVYSSAPQKLRARALTHFDGSTWRAAALPTEAWVEVDEAALEVRLRAWAGEVPGALFLPPGWAPGETEPPAATWSRVVRDSTGGGTLPVPARPLLLRLDASAPRIDAAGLFSVVEPVFVYAVANRRAPRPGAQPGAELSGLPRDLDPRLTALAARLAAGAGPGERVARTLAYLGSECAYSLKVGAFATRQPVAEFLFEKKRGYCEYFASAAAVLLRLQGVPTRYVTGFNVTEQSRTGDHYLVREADAHAWIDAWLPGEGWVELDPTPADQYAALHAPRRSGWFGSLLEPLRAFLAELIALARSGELARALRHAAAGAWAPLAAVAALWALRRGRRGLRARAGTGHAGQPVAPGVPPDLAHLLQRIERGWRAAGEPRPAARAPREHLDRIPREKLSPSLREASEHVVEAYYRACYAGVAVAPEELAELQRRVREASAPS